MESIENYDFEDDEKLKIQQLKEKLVNCFRNNELQIDEKINEPGKKIKITSVEDIVDAK